MLNAQSARRVFVDRAAAVVNDVEGLIEFYVFIWGDPEHRDAYETYFDPARPPQYSYKGDIRGREVCYEHGQDPLIGKTPIGVIVDNVVDNVGLKARAQLDKSNPFFARFIAEIRANELKTSSSTGEHVADFHPDGAFKDWLLLEVSLTKTPAEYSMPAVSLIRSDNEQTRDLSGSNGTQSDKSQNGENRMFNTPQPPAAREDVPPVGEPAPAEDAGAVIQQLVAQYGYDAVMAALQQLAPAQGEEPAAMAAPGGLSRSANFAQDLMAILEQNKAAAEVETLRRENAALKASRNAPPPAEDPHVRGGSPRISIGEEDRFTARSLPELLFIYETLKAHRSRPSEGLLQTIAGRAALAIEKKETLIHDPAVRSLMGKATRADEIVTSVNSGNGDEWIGVAYSGNLWEKARSSRIYQEIVSKGMRVEEVPQGHESVVIFTESTDPTVYSLTQSANLDATGRPTVIVPVTAPGTGNVTLTPGHVGMAVAYSTMFEEDSLIAAAGQLNRQMEEKAEETIEQLMINGDSASSGNVNLDGGTPTTQYYMATNGFRKYALVTGSSTSRSGGTLDENDFRLTLALLPSAIRTRKGQLAFIFDADTHNTALDITAIKTEDVKRTNATIVSGVLENIYGVDAYESGFIELADSDGKITSGGNVANTGSLLCVYAPFWAMGWKRKITIETQRDILGQANLIVATMRLGFLARGAGAAVETYNITIA